MARMNQRDNLTCQTKVTQFISPSGFMASRPLPWDLTGVSLVEYPIRAIRRLISTLRMQKGTDFDVCAFEWL